MKHIVMAAAVVVGMVGLVTVSGAASAEEPPGPRGVERVFRADANNDGLVTKDEVRTALANAFDRMDADQDGFFTQADRGARQQRPGHGDRMAEWDADGDGKISRQEFVDRDFGMFDRLDVNKDGAIDRTEASQARRGAGKRGG